MKFLFFHSNCNLHKENKYFIDWLKIPLGWLCSTLLIWDIVHMFLVTVIETYPRYLFCKYEDNYLKVHLQILFDFETYSNFKVVEKSSRFVLLMFLLLLLCRLHNFILITKMRVMWGQPLIWFCLFIILFSNVHFSFFFKQSRLMTQGIYYNKHTDNYPILGNVYI